MDSWEETLAAYNYDVPPELIAQRGAEPRESARLLVYSRAAKTTALATFADLPTYLPPGAVLVFNETRVIPARFLAHTKEGEEVSITVTSIKEGAIQTLSSRRVPLGNSVSSHGRDFSVKERQEQLTWYETHMSAEKMIAFLHLHGAAPLPPYIKHSPLTKEEAKADYQAVFARHDGSFAAPTASLHFSERLIESLKAKGMQIEFVTLHVGLGTFLPLTERNLSEGRLHEEFFSLSPDTAERLEAARREKRCVIPVGTTSLRTLESAFNDEGMLLRLSGTTDLFIRDDYAFKMAGGLITNFHVPQSSLLMLVDAFLGKKGSWRPLYERALEERFRLFSFGDGMLIL